MTRATWADFVRWCADRYRSWPVSQSLRDVADMVETEREADIALLVGICNGRSGVEALKAMWRKEAAEETT